MIIQSLLQMIFNVISFLTTPMDIPPLPSGVYDAIDQVISYVHNGISILSNYLNVQYLLILLGIVIYVDLSIYVYRVVMFILKKVPFLSIE